jgi:hypothetical protein
MVNLEIKSNEHNMIEYLIIIMCTKNNHKTKYKIYIKLATVLTVAKRKKMYRDLCFDNGHKPKGWSLEATGRYVATGSDNFSHLCPVFRGKWVMSETVLSLPGLRLGRKRARLRDSGVLIVPAPQRDRVKVF